MKLTPILGYEGRYSAAKNGRIYTHKFKRFLNPYKDKQGYLKIDLINKSFTLHRIIAKAFIPNPKNKPEVNHKNGIKADNKVSNLEWVTARENVMHAFKTGLRKKEVYIKAARENGKIMRAFSMKQVNEIKKEYSCGNITMKNLSKKHRAGIATIYRIIRNKTYAFG